MERDFMETELLRGWRGAARPWGSGPHRQEPAQPDRVGSMQCRVGTLGKEAGLPARASCSGGGRGQHQGQWPGCHTWKTSALLPAPAVTSTTRDDFLVVPAPPSSQMPLRPAGGQMDSVTWSDEGWERQGPMGEPMRAGLREQGALLTEVSSQQLGVSPLGPLPSP